MTTPKVTTKSSRGSRFYVHPGTDIQVPGVTSVINMLPKPFLTAWAAKMTAELAVDDLGTVVSMAARDRAAAVDYLKGASRRYTSEAAQTGTTAHDVFERLAKGESVDARTLPNDVALMAQHFDAFLQDNQPEFLAIEETVWSDTHGYAGSFDAIMRLPALDETVMTDWKTTQSGVRAEVALQLKAYREGDHILNADGSESPLPETTGAAVLHVRPEGAGLYPVRSDDEVFEVFLHLLGVFEWDRVLSKEVIAKPVYQTGSYTTKRRAPRKKATK